MTLEAEALVDRRRLKRHLTVWRIVGAILVLLLIGVLVAREAGPGGFRSHIARIDLSGIITDDRDMKELLERVRNSDNVEAVLLAVDSPGGTTTGGEAIYEEVRRLAEKKPVVAVCSTVAASAAYMVSLATDRIVLRGNTITGSVGVLMQWANVNHLLDKIGVKMETVKSGPLKAVPSPFEPTTDEAREVVQDMIDEAKRWFFGLVKKRRPVDPKDVPGLTDGRVYSGREAVKLKLADEIGGEREAVAWLEKEKGIDHGLSVVDWKPASDESWNPFTSAVSRVASWLGIDARLIGADGVRGLQLDGLVSLWHPPVSGSR